MSHFHFGNNCGFGRLFSQCPAVLSEPNGQRADPNRQWYTIVIRTKAAPQNPRRKPHGEPCGAALLPAQQILEHFCLSKRRNTASEILDRRKPALRFLPCLAPFVRCINHSRFYWTSSNYISSKFFFIFFGWHTTPCFSHTGQYTAISGAESQSVSCQPWCRK